MKIALCLEYPIGLQGGVSVLVNSCLKEFARQGHEVVLVSPDTPETLRETEAGRLIRGHFHWAAHPTSPGGARNLARRLAGARVQLAHFHLGGCYGWGNRFPNHCPVSHLDPLGVPCLTTVHSVDGVLVGFCGPQRSSWLKLLMLPLAWSGKALQLRHVRYEIVVSQHNLRRMSRRFLPFQSRFVQIYHSRLRADDPQLSAAQREPFILNVGHIAWRKGQAVLVEAFARIANRHPEWTLQLAGHDGDDGARERIRQLLKNHQLERRVRLLGQRADALDLMRRAAVYVQPSIAEALGLALQEAMFCGCPSIGSRVGGIPELLQDGQTGRLVEPGNVGQLSAALEELMRDATLRQVWGAAAAASVRTRGMTAEAMIRRHLELYAIAGTNR